MPATEEQLARVRAQVTHREYRVFLGGRRAYVNRSYFTQNEPVTFPAFTNLTADINEESTEIEVGSTVGYEDTGMVILAYGTNSEGWFTYTGKDSNTFTGCKPLWGIFRHRTGAQVGAWAEITPLVDTVRGYDFMTKTAKDWRVELTGHYHNSNLMLTDATVVILERVTPLGGVFGIWTKWNVIALGYARDWHPISDKDKNRAWKTTVESVSTYVRNHRISARRYGRVIASEGGTVTASTALVDTHDESAEWNYGDGDPSKENVIDGNNDTLYISNVAPSRTSETPGTNATQGGIYIDEVGAFPTSYMGSQVQWFSLRISSDHPDYVTGVSLRNIGIGNKQTLADGYATAADPDTSLVPYQFNGGNYYLRLPDIVLNEDSPAVVLCRNKQKFLQHYAVADGVEVYDWRFLNGFGNDGFTGKDFELDPTGDLLQVRYENINNIPFVVRDMVAWGTVAAFWIDGNDEDESNTQWNDPTTVTIPTDGSSIRRYPTQTDTNTAADWAEETDPVPGLSRVNNNPVYISTRLPLFTVNLADNITDSSPANGEWLELTDANELDESGNILIDSEEFHFTQRDDTRVLLDETGGRGANGTTPASHTTSALVYMVDDDLGATRYRKIDHVIIKRWMRLAEVGGQSIPIVPKYVDIWVSQEESPAYSGGGYRTDWVNEGALVTATNFQNATKWKIPLPIPIRARHRMLRIFEMSDGGRAKANEIQDIRYGLSGGVAQGHIAGVLRDMISEVIDLDDIAVNRDSFPGTVADLTTPPNSNLGTILDNVLGDYAGLIEYDKVNGGCRLQRHPIHPLGDREEIFATLGPASLQTDFPFSRVSRLRIGQVIVEMTDLESGDKYEGRYPPQAGTNGTIKRIPVKRAGGSPQAAAEYAEMLYKADTEISGKGWFKTTGIGDFLTTGQRLWVFLYDDDAYDNGRYENVMVTGVEHNNEDGGETVYIQEWRMS